MAAKFWIISSRLRGRVDVDRCHPVGAQTVHLILIPAEISGETTTPGRGAAAPGSGSNRGLAATGGFEYQGIAPATICSMISRLARPELLIAKHRLQQGKFIGQAYRQSRSWALLWGHHSKAAAARNKPGIATVKEVLQTGWSFYSALMTGIGLRE